MLVLFATSSIMSPYSLAINREELFNNNIIFYDPDAVIESCTISSASSSGEIGKITDYKNGSIFTDHQIEKVKEFQPFYEKAASAAGVPWQMIAVIHIRETNQSRSNHRNGQGIYQDYARENGPYPPGPVDDAEFQRQTDWAARFIKGKAGNKSSDLEQSNPEAVKYAFFGYNGRAPAYIKQARELGFSEEQAKNGEGSPYVMNLADEKRDPAKNPSGWGQIKSDGGSIKYPANNDHGAFVMYAALRGEIISSSSCGSGGVNTSFSEGGLSEEQAKQFMMNYGENKNNDSKNAVPNDWHRCGGGGSNCVTFTKFFLNKFTTDSGVPYGPLGDGRQVVSTLASKGIPTGTEPKVFAVFSTPGSPFGHTGIVLGIDGDNLIVGHASCGRGQSGISGKGDGTIDGGGSGFIRTSSSGKNVWWASGRPVTFAYPTVDKSLIEQYLGGEIGLP